MKQTLDYTGVSNAKWMTDPQVQRDVLGGIDRPSDAILPAETSLYRAAHRFRRDAQTSRMVANKEATAFASPWWSTYWDFNALLWAADPVDHAGAARSGYAVHRAWGGDCSLYASITLSTDLGVWYGIGRDVFARERGSTFVTMARPSQEVLQVYIPGFRDHARLWTTFRRVLAFEDRVSNGRGFQGHLPAALRPNR